jgi:hypothetical protein
MESDNGIISKYFTDVLLKFHDFEETILFESMLNKVLPQEYHDEKIKMVDFHASDGYNREFILKMQERDEYLFSERSQGYLDKLYSYSIYTKKI